MVGGGIVLATCARPLRLQDTRKDESPSKSRKDATIRQPLSQACGVAIRPSRDSFIGRKGRKKRDKKKSTGDGGVI